MSYRRIIVLSVLACVAVVFGTSAHAQPGTHGFQHYLLALPPVVSGSMSDAELLKQHPDSLDGTADINHIEAALNAYEKSLRADNEALVSTGPNSELAKNVHVSQSNTDEAVSTTSHINATVQSLPTNTLDTVVGVLQHMQAADSKFLRASGDIESEYNALLNVALTNARTVQQREPCGSSVDCSKRHRRTLNLALVAAERIRLNDLALLITNEIQALTPITSSIDALHPGSLMNLPKEQRKWYIALGMNATESITHIAERIKLSRIYLSQCCHLLQEAND